MPELGEQAATARAKLEDQLGAMSFLEHLEELRRRIINSFLAVLAAFCVCWYFAERIYLLMQQPIVQALQRHGLDPKLVYLSPTEPFNIYLKVAFMAGLFVASPVILHQVWLFVSPGLYRHEKRYVLPFMVCSVALFVTGGLFGYKIAYPAALDFLIGYGQQFQAMITVGEYTDLFLTIIIGLGVIFELPILVFFLALMGVVTAGWMWRNLRYAILGIFVVASIITPTTDIMNMIMFASPMLVLYLISIVVAWLVSPERRARKRESQSAS